MSSLSGTVVNANVSIKPWAEIGTVIATIHELTVTWEEGLGSGMGGSTNNATINGSTWNERWYGQNWTTAGGDFNQTVIDSEDGVVGTMYWTVTDVVQNIIDGATNYVLRNMVAVRMDLS